MSSLPCHLLPLLFLAALPGFAAAAPLLRCELAQGGRSLTLEAAPDPDPYKRATVDVFGRFLFKAVVAGDATHVDYIKLYVYQPEGASPRLLQMALYTAPAARPDGPVDALTGWQQLYSAGLEYELRYACALREVAR